MFDTHRATAEVDEREPTRAPTSGEARSIVVMTFGSNSLADLDCIANVARRLVSAKEDGAQVVCVVSAMGDTTAELLSLADTVTRRPSLRELDMVLSAGEQASAALVAMAVNELGHESISLTGAQAGVLTDTSYGHAKIIDVQTLRIRSELGQGRIVVVAGDQGLSADEDVTTLRGDGPDVTAEALTAALGARVCEASTDVGGIFGVVPQ